ncbi:MAG: leucine-rich repeat protein [Clostridia bacterium]|nr:leucine-rich repeat protein [Clostridia bacterium]
MKKIKKVLVGLLACLTVGCVAVGLAACEEESKKPANDGETVWTVETVYAKAKDLGFEGSLDEFLEAVKGAQGEKGETGAQGVGIKEIKLNKLGELVIVLTNGTETNLGKIAGQVTIENAEEFDFYLMDDGTYGVKAGNACYLTELTIPSMYKGRKVTKILDYFFGENSRYVKTQKLTIPDTVTSIENSAFSQCSSLTSITIPNSVTSIGNDAFGFEGRTEPIDVYITDMVAWCNIAFDGIFANPLWRDGNLHLNNQIVKELKIPNSVTTIGNYAFNGCDSLMSITIPNSVTSIGNSAFKACDKLTSITIPNSVTSIGKEAFFGCYSLVEVVNKSLHFTVEKDSSENGFLGCYALAVYNNEDTFTGTKLTNDNGYVVYTDGVEKILVGYCGEETALTLPSYITEINQYAFKYCSSLTSITIPNGVTSIGKEAFYYCANLTSITIPNSVTSIGDYAFNDCSNLTSATIGNGVTSIGSCAFIRCSSLTSVTIGSGVTSIGGWAFERCSSLRSITFTGTVEEWNKIEKDTFWNSFVPATKVVCTDGEVAL